MENTNPWFIEGSSKARLVAHTPEPEGMMGYVARVTSKDQTNPNVKGRPLFSMLVKPNKPMNEEVIAIHKISNEQVQHQPIFPQVAKMVAFVLENKHVVCWNSDFDIKLLWSLFKKYDQKLPDIAGASCAMDRYSEWVGDWNKSKDGFKWQRLPALSGLSAHDAFADCLSTIRVLEMMAAGSKREEIEAEEIDLDF